MIQEHQPNPVPPRPPGEVNSLAFVASEHPVARDARDQLLAQYGHVADAPEKADAIVALGGDGFMLETLHRYLGRGVPIYGMNLGSVGFLMNAYAEAGLLERVRNAELVHLHPLRMTARTLDGAEHNALAINEVSLFRESRQTAKIGIEVDGVDRLSELACDGILVATPAGSTAYNLSAYGPILPIGAELLALTPISPFRPRRWRGALLPHRAQVHFHVIEADKRPVSATADFTEVRDVCRVAVHEDQDTSVCLLFDPEHNLEERILKEQFQP